MQMEIPQDMIDMAQIGVDEPFPSDHTADAIQQWINRNEGQLLDLSRMVLEDLIAERTAPATIH